MRLLQQIISHFECSVFSDGGDIVTAGNKAIIAAVKEETTFSLLPVQLELPMKVVKNLIPL